MATGASPVYLLIIVLSRPCSGGQTRSFYRVPEIGITVPCRTPGRPERISACDGVPELCFAVTNKPLNSVNDPCMGQRAAGHV
jgi:hypothetical protein